MWIIVDRQTNYFSEVMKVTVINSRGSTGDDEGIKWRTERWPEEEWWSKVPGTSAYGASWEGASAHCHCYPSLEDGYGASPQRRVSKDKYTSGNKVVWNEVDVANRSAMLSYINFETVINL